ncbi:MAG TPA: site-specific DNA-methyltransferase [Thermoanaerobaculia bacterium]|nr:site-specific DNA-methyltransferase [Thermoanaerobaculia bacterium]
MFEVPQMSATPSQLSMGQLRRRAHFTLPSGDEPVLLTKQGVLYQTDCLNVFAALDDNVLDAIFADPPFNLGKRYGNGEVRDDLADHEYLKWCYGWLRESIRVLKPGASLFVYNIPRWSYRIAAFLEDEGMRFRHWIALTMKGTFPRGKKLYPAHYALLYFTKGDPKTFNRVRLPVPACRHCGGDIKDYGGHRKYLNPLGLNLTDFWEDTSPARHSKFKARWHVNELKPMIAARCFEISTNPHELVMDPFGGGGSSFEASSSLHRYWIGSEMTDCQHIVERINTAFPKDAGKMPPKDVFSIFR